MTYGSRLVLMAALSAALVSTGCQSRTGLAGPDSGAPVPSNPNPDTADPIIFVDAPGVDTTSPVPPAGAANLTVSPPNVDLGTIDVGVTSSPVVVTVTNTGNAISGPLTVTVAGTGLVVSGCSGMTLAPRANCIITIKANAAVVGRISGTIEVADSAASSQRISVTGIVVSPGMRLTLAPSPLDLGTVVMGKTTTESIAMTNGTPFDLTGIVITVSGTGFSRSATGTCTDTLASGQFCTIDVSFAATVTGLAKGTVTVQQGGVIFSVPVTVKVPSPGAPLFMSPPSASLQTVVGTPSSPVIFKVAGDLSTGVTVTITGSNAKDFSFSSDCPTIATTGANDTCQVTVVYNPKTAPTTNSVATLTVAQPGAVGGAATANLTGTATSSPGMCVAVPPCGGDVVGTWTVKSSCLKASGSSDISYLGLTCVPNVATITGSASVSGSLTLGADGKYTDNTVTTGSDSWQLDRSCTILSGTVVKCEAIGAVFSSSLSIYGYESFICQDVASSGGCTCQGKINQPGGMGLLCNDAMPKGKYRTASNKLTLGDWLTYSYCVNGDEMTLSPAPDWSTSFSTPYQGTVVLQRSGG